MRRFSLKASWGYSLIALKNVSRRLGWFVEHLTLRKVANALIACTQFILKHEVMKAWPVIVKVDISPLCNLQCTICVHARPTESSSAALKAQTFSGNQKMRLDQFKRIVDELSGKSVAISMYYLGDPFVHPDLDSLCRMASDAGLNSHVSTNFSFVLSDQRIADIVTSGLTHLTVCVDGLSQETYGRTRVGGRIDVVLGNLERLMQCRRKLGRRYPRVEVQFIKFQHNVDELQEANRRFRALGVDQIVDFWGTLHNFTDFNSDQDAQLTPKKDKRLPQCYWPHFALLIKFNGDVIPCCSHRLESQYSKLGDQRNVGNVFNTSIWDVWNSRQYQALRRIVSNPGRIEKEIGLTRTFCAGCPKIFDTKIDRLVRTGDTYRWEELYTLDDRSRVVRKPAAEPERADSGSP
jgi:MoaA/NifB/PqqE/SkfB family radical SAM enzyme